MDRLKNQTIKELRSQIKDQNQTINSLLNRLQSGDLRTFHSLQTHIQPDQEVYPRTDEAELEQLKALGASIGLGEAIYDDEFTATAAEFGFDIPDGSVPGNEEPK